MAQVVTGWLVVGTPDIDRAEECPSCGFDSLLTFPVSAISTAGVSTWPPVKACPRCHDKAAR